MPLSLGSHTLPFGIHKFCFNVTYLNTVGQASENLGKLSMFQWLCSVPVFVPGHTEQLGMGCLDHEVLTIFKSGLWEFELFNHFCELYF